MIISDSAKQNQVIHLSMNIDIKSNFHIFIYKIQNDDLSQLKKDIYPAYHLSGWFLFWHEMKNRFRCVNNCMLDAHHLRSTKKGGGG